MAVSRLKSARLTSLPKVVPVRTTSSSAMFSMAPVSGAGRVSVSAAQGARTRRVKVRLPRSAGVRLASASSAVRVTA